MTTHWPLPPQNPHCLSAYLGIFDPPPLPHYVRTSWMEAPFAKSTYFSADYGLMGTCGTCHMHLNHNAEIFCATSRMPEASVSNLICNSQPSLTFVWFQRGTGSSHCIRSPALAFAISDTSPHLLASLRRRSLLRQPYHAFRLPLSVLLLSELAASVRFGA